jgi:hypothetical protein
LISSEKKKELSVVSAGLMALVSHQPALQALGYFLLSLRDKDSAFGISDFRAPAPDAGCPRHQTIVYSGRAAAS